MLVRSHLFFLQLFSSLLMPQQSFTQLSNGSGEGPSLINACSLPNLDQVESDPDYNVTLTADMFTGMRQAISAAQNMDTDISNTPPNSPKFVYSQINTSRPHFFLGKHNSKTHLDSSAKACFFLTTSLINSIPRRIPTKI